ncbi:heat shock protein 70 putative [Entamoeba histolytica]|uniref:Heat shock protein 70, putative n=2 Tax=Entamoeba histolytica TaxID=5759 RepID=C4M340_ENTH1|nr:heat shock protein 70, putative [Entamoeba histolytica HM-1:IMSS]EAL47498.2 heat shock protein 70, putative [Entamoeba histolytica HM-1:IMSS]GAT95718.1 heat shock protein 70 putative [Entamoeba histolytica]|eukprot:XP_652884.2 heat shock protein 70, putative [Entamoeba histolytica HM-1:IMSS]
MSLQELTEVPIHIGIDLGTTYSSIAIYSENETNPVEVLQISNNEFSIPSWVEIFKGGDGLKKYNVGLIAKKNGGICLHDSKRLIGETVKHYNEQKNLLPTFTSFEVSTDNNEIKMCVDDPLDSSKQESFYPIEVSAMVLRTLYNILVKRIGNRKIGKVVITVPVSFTPKQKKETIQACKMAGFEDITSLEEPFASILEYQREHHVKDKSKIIVIDCGGGTTDVACYFRKQQEPNALNEIKTECICNESDLNLGGNNFDDSLIKIILDKIKESVDDSTFNKLFVVKNSDTKKTKKMKLKAMKQIRNIAEDVKKSFSGNLSYSPIDLYSISEELDGSIEVTREEFEEQCQKDGLIERIKRCIENVMKGARWNVSDVDYVLPIGGSCCIPLVKKTICDMFGEKKIIGFGSDGYLSVVKGASYRAYQISINKEDDITQVMPYTLGFGMVNNKYDVFAPKGRKLPITFEGEYFNAFDNQSDIVDTIYKGEGQKTNEEGMELVTKVTIEGLPPGLKAGEFKIIDKTTVNRSGLVEVEIVKKETGKYLEKMKAFVNLGFDEDMLKKLQQHLEPYIKNSE